MSVLVKYCRKHTSAQIAAGTVNASAKTITVNQQTYPDGTIFFGSDGGLWQFNGTALVKVGEKNAITSVAGKTGAVTLTKADVGLSNVENLTKAQIISGLATETYVNNHVAGLFHYAGSVASVNDLPSLGMNQDGTRIANGTVYNCTDTGMNYVAVTEGSDANNRRWDALGSTADLSGYYTKTQVDALPAVASGITAAKVTKYDGYESTINGKQAALSTVQLNAANSGITGSKVRNYDGYASGKQNTLSAAQLAAANSGITAEILSALYWQGE